MASYKIKDRLLPYKILAYLLYSETEWIEPLKGGKVRLTTGQMSRALRIKNSRLWEQLYWMERQRLISSIDKEEKRGHAVITLMPPRNI